MTSKKKVFKKVKGPGLKDITIKKDTIRGLENTSVMVKIFGDGAIEIRTNPFFCADLSKTGQRRLRKLLDENRITKLVKAHEKKWTKVR